MCMRGVTKVHHLDYLVVPVYGGISQSPRILKIKDWKEKHKIQLPISSNTRRGNAQLRV